MLKVTLMAKLKYLSLVSKLFVVVNINSEDLTRVFPLAGHEVVVGWRIVWSRGWPRAVASVASTSVEGGVSHGVGGGNLLGHVWSTWQTVRGVAAATWPRSARVSLVISATRGGRMVPPAHLGVLSLEGVVAVVVVGGGGVAGGRAHGSTVVLPLALAQQLLLKQINIVLILLVQCHEQLIKIKLPPIRMQRLWEKRMWE